MEHGHFGASQIIPLVCTLLLSILPSHMTAINARHTVFLHCWCHTIMGIFMEQKLFFVSLFESCLLSLHNVTIVHSHEILPMCQWQNY